MEALTLNQIAAAVHGRLVGTETLMRSHCHRGVHRQP